MMKEQTKKNKVNELHVIIASMKLDYLERACNSEKDPFLRNALHKEGLLAKDEFMTKFRELKKQAK